MAKNRTLEHLSQSLQNSIVALDGAKTETQRRVRYKAFLRAATELDTRIKECEDWMSENYLNGELPDEMVGEIMKKYVDAFNVSMEAKKHV